MPTTNTSSTELAFVELLRQSCPGVVVDAVVVDELIGRREQVGLERRPRRCGRAARDRLDVLGCHRVLFGGLRVLDPLVARARPPRDAQDHELAQPVSERGLFQEHAVEGRNGPASAGWCINVVSTFGSRTASGPAERNRSAAVGKAARRAARASSPQRSTGSGASRGLRRQVHAAVQSSREPSIPRNGRSSVDSLNSKENLIATTAAAR